MRSWTTFKRPLKWGQIIDKPAILADNRITANEIVGELISLLGLMPGFFLSESDQSINNKNSFFGINSQLLQWQVWSDNNIYLSTPFNVTRQGTLSVSRIKLSDMPSSSTGLTTGTLYKDNGFVKIV